MRTLFAIVLISGLIVPPAGAQSADHADCASPPSPREGIAACTRLLQSGQLGARGQAAVLGNRAIYHAQLRQTEPALRDANRALALDAGNGRAYVTRGAVHEMMGRRAAAIRDYKQALASNDEHGCEKASANLRRLGIEPGPDRTEPETDPGPHIVFRIRNRTGSSIGVAFYSHTRRCYWGVGFENSESCSSCCYRCLSQTTNIQNMNPAP